MKLVGLVFEEPKKEAPKTEKKAQTAAYVCEECGKEFTTKAALTGHMKAHRSDKA